MRRAFVTGEEAPRPFAWNSSKRTLASPFQPPVGAAVHASVAVVPVRSAAADAAEQVTQLLIGEAATVLAHGERDWVHVRGSHDGYAGWCDGKMLQSAPDFAPNFLLRSACQPAHYEDGATRLLPAGGWLEARGDELFAPCGTRVEVTHQEDGWRAWLGAPYQWGGRTVLGVDCSGLMQVLARLEQPDAFVDRDAADQIQLGQATSFDSHAAGDWAFFQNPSGRVVHVGLIVAPGQILHAAGEVRLDRLTAEGIVRELPDGQSLLTHALSGIRRHPGFAAAAARNSGEQR